MRTVLLRGLAALLAGLLAIALWDLLTYDAAAWQGDYEGLKRDMARSHANLDWIAGHRGLDLRRLDEETRAAIDSAYFRVRAVAALQRFVAAFADPHLRMRPDDGAAHEAATELPPASCEAAGYMAVELGFRFPFASVPGFVDHGGDTFAIASIGDTGVLRIAQFGENMYLAACRSVFRPGIDRRGLQLEVRALLQRQLRSALETLRAHGASRLLVDISGNGGGSEWVEEVIALLTDRALTRAPARMAAPTCDRAGIWRGEAVCPVLTPAGARARLQGEGAWTGPVLLLTDRGTASASEDLVAWLQQNGVAMVIGERTRGSGCGYVDGGASTRLRSSGMMVMIPNCARFLDDGTDEIEGIAVDVALPMRGPDWLRAAALGRTLAVLRGPARSTAR